MRQTQMDPSRGRESGKRELARRVLATSARTRCTHNVAGRIMRIKQRGRPVPDGAHSQAQCDD